jgi:hypothetical protein
LCSHAPFFRLAQPKAATKYSRLAEKGRTLNSGELCPFNCSKLMECREHVVINAYYSFANHNIQRLTHGTCFGEFVIEIRDKGQFDIAVALGYPLRL